MNKNEDETKTKQAPTGVGVEPLVKCKCPHCQIYFTPVFYIERADHEGFERLDGLSVLDYLALQYKEHPAYKKAMTEGL